MALEQIPVFCICDEYEKIMQNLVIECYLLALVMAVLSNGEANFRNEQVVAPMEILWNVLCTCDG